MNGRGLGAYRLRLKLRIMSDEDLWSLFRDHREECSREFWEEVENRKGCWALSEDSPFWTMGNVGRLLHTRGSEKSNLIELTREEWEARRRRKMFRVISA